jgi:predicted MPP superfamily phosphohydrolase
VIRALGRIAAVSVAGGVVWGSIEARCLQERVLDIRLRDLPAALDGATILHLSDVHAGHGPGIAMLERAASWSEQLRPDLIALTGDLVTRARGIERLQRAASRLAATATHGSYAVSGNHDHGDATDPFADGSSVDELAGFELLAGHAARVELRGQRVSIVGADAGTPSRKRYLDAFSQVDRTADLRLLLCHFPSVLDRVPPGAFQLVLSGHLHGGQICIPAPGGRVGLAHPRARYLGGLYQREGTLMHISPGLGTTFLPFRVLAPPEATLLVLHPA